MIDKRKLTDIVEGYLDSTGSDLFLVSVKVNSDNVVTVTIDSPTGVDIDRCVELTRFIEDHFDRDTEDYELEVGSAGITAPFTVAEQYFMNVGNDVEVLTRDGRKLRGVLDEVDDDCENIVVGVPTKVRNDGEKRPHIENVPVRLAVDDIKSITRDLRF